MRMKCKLTAFLRNAFLHIYYSLYFSIKIFIVYFANDSNMIDTKQPYRNSKNN